MNFERWEGLIIAIFVALLATVCTFGFTSIVYYHRGVQNTKIYYETTGTFPTETWLDKFGNQTLKYPDQVRESLKPFTLSK